MHRPDQSPLERRSAGLLLHPTSLPGPHGAGDIGAKAHAFVQRLAQAKQSWWQMLPVVVPGRGNSPYATPTAFAGNPQLLDLDALVARGWLAQSDLAHPPPLDDDRVLFDAAEAHRTGLLRRAHAAFVAGSTADDRAAMSAFETTAAHWLLDYALFASLARRFDGASWIHWPSDIRDREPAALDRARAELAEDIAFEIFCQWRFDVDWNALRDAARTHGVSLLGDLPIFMDVNSADVWANRRLFDLLADGSPRVVAGVPPDAFSATGQRWGNALYRWDVLASEGYRWWLDRLASSLARFDAVRIDHFIGLSRYWEIPVDEPTAIGGRFVPGPGDAFLDTVRRELGTSRIVAEDLGILTPEVVALRDGFGLPGMRVLQFSFDPGPGGEPFRPHHYPENSIAYTGTHDNDTSVGWYRALGETDAGRAEQALVREYAQTDGGGGFHWAFIDVAHRTASRLAIVPVQDVLGLGTEARMNRPGTAEGNWAWRMREGSLTDGTLERLAEATERHTRAPRRDG
ncbi:MAG: 4-alpha-glucanotransferase [Polyangiales bacterium]|nr:4-alpha-glucanotransferase [Myxococcales bacterium]